MDPLSHLKRGDANYFKVAPAEVLLSYFDDAGDSILGRAVKENQLACCQELFKRFPELLYHQSFGGNPPLDHASSRENKEMIKFLVQAAEEVESGNMAVDIESGRKLKMLTMQHGGGGTALHIAVALNKIESVKALIEADNDHELIGIVNNLQDTALHEAAKRDNIIAAKLIIAAAPDFEYGVNHMGETPLLIALCSDGNGTAIAKWIIEKLPDQCKIQTGEKQWTALHHATSTGNLSVVDKILRFCPECAEIVDDEGRNFLHIAANYGHANIIKRVLGTKEIDVSLLDGQDNKGNTPLHTAALSNEEDVARLLLYDPRVNKNSMNVTGQKVLQAISFNYDMEKAKVYGVREKVNEKELKDQSDFDLLVAALIATVSFTAGITVPGGYNSDGPNKGMAVLSKQKAFDTFVVSNTFALLLSLYAVLSHFCTRRLLRKKDIDLQVKVATGCTLGGVFAMVVAFVSGSYSVLAISDGLAMFVCASCVTFFLLAFVAIWRMVMQYRNPTNSCCGFF